MMFNQGFYYALIPYFCPMARNILFSFCFLLSVGLGAQSAALATARAALQTDDAKAQVAALDSLVHTRAVSPAAYQALGNAYFQRGDYGRAILSYERGLRLKPGHKALKNNLSYVRAEAGINRPELPDFFLLRWWRAIGAALGAGTLFWLALLFWWLAVAGAVTWFLRRKEMEEKKRFALLPAAAIALVLAVVCLSIGNSRNAYLEQDREAVLVARTADLRVAPGPDATLEQSLTAGLRLRILDEFDGFVKVALEDGKQGWLPGTAVERI